MQRAASVGSLAFVYVREGKIQSAMEFVPFYLRKSQAEREYEEKIKNNLSGDFYDSDSSYERGRHRQSL